MDRMLGQKGGSRPHAQQHHSVPQGHIPNQVSTDYRKPTTNHMASTWPKYTQLLQGHSATCTLPTPKLTLFPFVGGGATPPPHNHVHQPHTFVAFLLALQCTKSYSLIFDLLPCPRKRITRPRSQGGTTTCISYRYVPFMRLKSPTLDRKNTPAWKQ